MDTKETIHSMKKVVLHIHLDGSLRPETVQNWFREEGELVKINELKKKLDKSIEDDCEFSIIYDLSIALDKLIVQYYQKDA